MKRKTGIAAENVIITPLSQGEEETAADTVVADSPEEEANLLDSEPSDILE